MGSVAESLRFKILQYDLFLCGKLEVDVVNRTDLPCFYEFCGNDLPVILQEAKPGAPVILTKNQKALRKMLDGMGYNRLKKFILAYTQFLIQFEIDNPTPGSVVATPSVLAAILCGTYTRDGTQTQEVLGR